MANYEIPTNPEYSEVMRKLENTDPATAELFNSMFQQMLNNFAAISKGLKAVGNSERLGGKEANYYSSIMIGTKEPTECNVLWFNTSINQSGVATVSLDLEEGADNDGIQANIDGEMYAVQNSADSPTDENGTYSYEIL